jgi:hypothetical protein
MNVHCTPSPTAVTYITLNHEILVNMFGCGMSTTEQLKPLSLALGIVIIHLFQVLAITMFSFFMTLLEVTSPGVLITFVFFVFGISLSIIAFIPGQVASRLQYRATLTKCSHKLEASNELPLMPAVTLSQEEPSEYLTTEVKDSHNSKNGTIIDDTTKQNNNATQKLDENTDASPAQGPELSRSQYS